MSTNNENPTTAYESSLVPPAADEILTEKVGVAADAGGSVTEAGVADGDGRDSSATAAVGDAGEASAASAASVGEASGGAASTPVGTSVPTSSYTAPPAPGAPAATGAGAGFSPGFGAQAGAGASTVAGTAIEPGKRKRLPVRSGPIVFGFLLLILAFWVSSDVIAPNTSIDRLTVVFTGIIGAGIALVVVGIVAAFRRS